MLGMPRREMTSQNTSFRNNFCMTPLLIVTVVVLDALKNLLRLKGTLDMAQGQSAAVWVVGPGPQRGVGALDCKCCGSRRAAAGSPAASGNQRSAAPPGCRQVVPQLCRQVAGDQEPA